jgi:hypothetical protein
MFDDDLTSSERRVWVAIGAGDSVDFRDPEDPELEDAASGASWGSERSVRAGVLIELLTTERGPKGQQPRSARLAGARITGRLDLEGLILVRPLDLDTCFFEEAVRLDEARAPRLELKRCWVPGLSARQFETRGDLTLDWLTGAREVLLAGARIGGVLSLRHAQLDNGDGVVLDGDRLDVHLEMDCSHLQATGRVKLLGAQIGGQLSLAGARLSNQNATALSASGLQVSGDMFCEAVDGNPFEAIGELRLLGAHITGVLSFDGARLSNQNATALAADGLQVDGDMLCQAVDGQRFEAAGELRLPGAHVGGQLSFRGARLTNESGPALTADGLRVDRGMVCWPVDGQPFEATGELRLSSAQIGGRLNLEGARLTNERGPALSADGVRIAQEMLCCAVGGKPFAAIGELQLAGAQIGGQLNFQGARLSNPSGPALGADGLRVSEDMFCQAVDGQPFEAIGELRIPGAQIGGQLSFEGARLSNPSGPALTADGLRVDRGMFCQAVDGQPFEAIGELRMLGAQIGGQLSFQGARLSNPSGPALSADGLRVDQEMYCHALNGQPFEAIGELRMPGAQIGGQLSFRDARLSNPLGLTHINLQSIEALELWLPRDCPHDGMVDLTDAVVGQLHDRWQLAHAGGSPPGYQVRLRGFIYQSLGAGSDNCDARLEWLRHAADGYDPQGYDHLAVVFARAGREEDVRRVRIAKQRRRRKYLPAPAKATSWLLDVAVGYGYRTWRAALALLAIILIGWGVFAAAFPEHMTATRPSGEMPSFHAWLYSIDAVLPVINLGQESAWNPSGAAQIWYAFGALAGWLLGLGFVAYLTARLFRE